MLDFLTSEKLQEKKCWKHDGLLSEFDTDAKCEDRYTDCRDWQSCHSIEQSARKAQTVE